MTCLISGKLLIRLVGAALLGAVTACAGVGPTGTSTAYEPPAPWAAGVYFVFDDSTFVRNVDYAARIEFSDGTAERVLTARNLFEAPTGERRSPWYRLRPGREGTPTLIRVTLSHRDGARTTAEYPLTIRADEFVTVLATVYTRDPDEWYISMPEGWRSYRLASGARMSPGDSLWIRYAVRNRDCFGCPR